MRLAGLLLASGLAAALAAPLPARAHDARPAYLELREIAPDRYDLVWRTPVLAGRRLPVALRLPEDVRAAGEPRVRELRDSVVEQRALEVPGGIAGRRIEFPGLELTISDVLVRVQPLAGAPTTTLVRRSRPWLEVPAARGSLAVAGDYLRHGVGHILLGFDHLLFVLALCLIVPTRRALLATITAFTAAHSLTLAGAALGVVRVPSAPVEATIALSVVLLAGEIPRARRGAPGLIQRRPWLVALPFGLLHGFGFAGALVEVGLPPGDVPLALVAFNAGVELGQLAFIAALAALAALAAPLRRHAFVHGLARPASAYAIGSLAAFWFFERLAGFAP